jgi:hypothetical protein
MRRTHTMVALCGVVGGLLLLLAPAASAQTGYPPGLCTTTSGVQNVGNVNVGQRFVLQLAPTCVFTPGSPITVTVNGVNIPGKVANPSGYVLVDITVVSATQLSIDDPVLTPAICGTNTAVATGPSATAQGGVSTQTANFTITCPVVPAAVTGTASAASGGLLSRTGANSVRYAAVALALVVAGSMVLVVTRRRRADQTI